MPLPLVLRRPSLLFLKAEGRATVGPSSRLKRCGVVAGTEVSTPHGEWWPQPPLERKFLQLTPLDPETIREGPHPALLKRKCCRLHAASGLHFPEFPNGSTALPVWGGTASDYNSQNDLRGSASAFPPLFLLVKFNLLFFFPRKN